MTKSFNKIKKLHFWPIFPIFGAKKTFSKKSGSAMHNFIWICNTLPKLEKTNDTIPRKRLERGRTEVRTEIKTPFPLTLGVQNIAPSLANQTVSTFT